MIEIVLTALGLGLFLSFSFGPVFFELINTSLRKGFKAAFLMETGVLFSDLVYLFLALFHLISLLKQGILGVFFCNHRKDKVFCYFPQG